MGLEEQIKAYQVILAERRPRIHAWWVKAIALQLALGEEALTLPHFTESPEAAGWQVLRDAQTAMSQSRLTHALE